MATSRETTPFRCRKCKRKGEITISETDHPYNSDVNYFVTSGFAAIEPVYLGSPKVRCIACDRTVLE